MSTHIINIRRFWLPLISTLLFTTSDLNAFTCDMVADEIADIMPTYLFKVGGTQVRVFQPHKKMPREKLEWIEEAVTTSLDGVYSGLKRPPNLNIIFSKKGENFLGGDAVIEISDRFSRKKFNLEIEMLSKEQLQLVTVHELGHVIFGEQYFRNAVKMIGTRVGIESLESMAMLLKLHNYDVGLYLKTLPPNAPHRAMLEKILSKVMPYQELFCDFASEIHFGKSNLTATLIENPYRSFAVPNVSYRDVIDTYNRKNLYEIFYPTRLYLHENVDMNRVRSNTEKYRLVQNVFEAIRRDLKAMHEGEGLGSDVNGGLNNVRTLNLRLIEQLEQTLQ